MDKKTKLLLITALLFIFWFGDWTQKQLIEYIGKNKATEVTKTPTPTVILRTAAKVIRVVDGDTVEIENGQKVRYIGIDTPETVKPRVVVQCFGKEASNRNKELVEGKTVELEKDISETDKYGRLLRYVWIDGKMINEQLVSEGYARISTFPPDVKYSQIFLAAEKEARLGNVGLWKKCNN